MSGVVVHKAFFKFYVQTISRESKKGRKVDALAHRGDEGRDKLR